MPFDTLHRLKNMNQQAEFKRPGGVTLIAIVNAVGLIITLLFWGVVFFQRLVPWPSTLTTVTERANAATTYGFMLGDILWSAPLLALATVGLWRLRSWGWLMAQMVHALWVYSMTLIWMRDAYSSVSPGAWLFTPFALVALWATLYLWRYRDLFWANKKIS